MSQNGTKGFKEIEKKLKKISEELTSNSQKELLKYAEAIAIDAQLLCQDSESRNSIRYELDVKGETISITFSCNEKARDCLKQAFEESKDKMPIYIASAFRESLNGK